MLVHILDHLGGYRPFGFQEKEIAQRTGMVNSTHGDNQEETPDQYAPVKLLATLDRHKTKPPTAVAPNSRCPPQE